MNESEQIIDLIKALAKAQGEMKPAIFNKKNPHFKSRYADFTSCIEACRDPLKNNDLSIMQYTEKKESDLFLVTRLFHASGQWIKSYFPLCPKSMDSQILGSAISYAKRYALSAMLCIVADEDADSDDDGEAAQGRMKSQQNYQDVAPAAKVVPRINSNQVQYIKGLFSKLDDECKNKINAWLWKQCNISNFEQIPMDLYEQVLSTVENAIKYMEQKEVERQVEKQACVK